MRAIREAHWLVVGLGNPGSEYARTRHNVGFEVVERLAVLARVRFIRGRFQVQVARAELAGMPVLLLKPQAFMNRSGPPVVAWLEATGLPAARLVAVHDDLDLPLGRLRITGGAGSAGHRGVASIQAALQTRAFPRVRVGIGRPREDEGAVDRVLEEFGPEELPAVEEMVDRAAGAVQALIRDGLACAMNRYNVRASVGDASV